MKDDRAYFIRRAAQERVAADNAANRKACEAHEAMAEHYDALAQAAQEPGQLDPAPVQPAPSA